MQRSWEKKKLKNHSLIAIWRTLFFFLCAPQESSVTFQFRSSMLGGFWSTGLAQWPRLLPLAGPRERPALVVWGWERTDGGNDYSVCWAAGWNEDRPRQARSYSLHAVSFHLFIVGPMLCLKHISPKHIHYAARSADSKWSMALRWGFCQSSGTIKQIGNTNVYKLHISLGAAQCWADDFNAMAGRCIFAQSITYSLYHWYNLCLENH